MLKSIPRLLWLETLFLGLTFVFSINKLSGYTYEIKFFSFDVFFATGNVAPGSILSTVVIGYIFTLLYQKSLGKEYSKWSKGLAITGIAAFSFETLRLFVEIPLMLNFQFGLIILIIDHVRHYKKNKKRLAIK